MNLNLILAIVAGLVGLPALWSVVIDVLKQYGVVTDGNAGKWNAGFSIACLVIVAALTTFFPKIDIGSYDAMLVDIAKFASMLVALLIQMGIAKGVHAMTARAVMAFSYSRMALKHRK